MVVFESVKGFFEILISPLKTVFEYFPDYKNIIGGILILSLGYFGWRAIK